MRRENGAARRTRFGAQGAIYPGEEDNDPKSWVEGFDGLETRKAVAVEEMGTRARYDRVVEGQR